MGSEFRSQTQWISMLLVFSMFCFCVALEQSPNMINAHFVDNGCSCQWFKVLATTKIQSEVCGWRKKNEMAKEETSQSLVSIQWSVWFFCFGVLQNAWRARTDNFNVLSLYWRVRHFEHVLIAIMSPTELILPLVTEVDWPVVDVDAGRKVWLIVSRWHQSVD